MKNVVACRVDTSRRYGDLQIDNPLYVGCNVRTTKQNDKKGGGKGKVQIPVCHKLSLAEQRVGLV